MSERPSDKTVIDYEPVGPKERRDPENLNAFFRRFMVTPKMLFDKDPNSKALRQAVFIERYLVRLVEYLKRKLPIDEEEAKAYVIGFTDRLFASPAIQENAYGYYRVYLATAVLNFAKKEHLRDIPHEKKRKKALAWIAISCWQLQRCLVERIFSVELNQITKALETGFFEDYLNDALEYNEFSKQDVEIWVLTYHKRMTRREIVAYLGNVTMSGVKHALERVNGYLRRHAKELQRLLNDL